MDTVTKTVIFSTAYTPVVFCLFLLKMYHCDWKSACFYLFVVAIQLFSVARWLKKCQTAIETKAIIKNSKPRHTEAVGYVFSYSLPLISIVSGKLEVMIITSGLLMFFAIAYIRMGMPYANPTLYILGYKIYDVTIKESGKSIIVLTKQVNIKTNTIYILNKLDNYNYYLKEQGGRAISDV